MHCCLFPRGAYYSRLASGGERLQFAYADSVSRQARAVIAGLPRHITQWGNNREAVFFADGHRVVYLDLLRYGGRKDMRTDSDGEEALAAPQHADRPPIRS